MRKNPKSAIQIILSCLIILMGGALIVKAATTIGTNIDTGGSLTVSGNIGIGTSTPAWNLQVSGTYPSVALSDYSSAIDSKHWLFSSMGGNLYIGTSTDAYATSTPPVLTILNNGKIGIGTTSLTMELNITGRTYMRNTKGNNALTIDSNSMPLYLTRYSDSASNSAGNLMLLRAMGTIDAPSSVQQDVAIGIIMARGYGATSWVSANAGELIFYAAENFTDSAQGTYFTIRTNPIGSKTNVERLRLTASGNVGIATTSPNNKLTIYDASKAGLEFSGASGSTYKWTIGMDKSDAGKFKIASSTALGTSDRLVIDGAGNVSVGGYATTTAAGVFSPGRYPTGSTPTCTTNEEGGFLWNSTTKKTCVCTGSSWIEATSTTPTVCF